MQSSALDTTTIVTSHHSEAAHGHHAHPDHRIFGIIVFLVADKIKLAENVLVKADITTNKNMVPFDDKSPFVTSGIRLGTPAITTRGVKEKDCIKIAQLIDEVLMNHENETRIASVKKKVHGMMERFPLY